MLLGSHNRIVFALPSNLDSHLVGPSINGGERFHTAFYQRTYYADGTYWNVFKLTIGSGGTIDSINTYDAVETLS